MDQDEDIALVSVVINTDRRRDGLEKTIESLRHLDYPRFEVCVVCGPSDDGTHEFVEGLRRTGAVKSAQCFVRNLSQSRNLGIALASGEFVAFIDDDAIPEPEWLSHLIPAFRDRSVGGAGGVVFDHSGYEHQYLYSSCDRLGNSTNNLLHPVTGLSFPLSARFPYVQGTNCIFKRSTLVELGGFDEEYEFYLDETDLCCRLVDAGYVIAQLPNAPVHHKVLPSHIRNDLRITFNKYQVIKNKIYFSLINNREHFPLDRVLADNMKFIERERRDLQFHLDCGHIDASRLVNFDDDVSRAWDAGLRRGLSGERRVRPISFFGEPNAFVPFPAIRAEGPRKTFAFLNQNFPPSQGAGTGRITHDVAKALGMLGHKVHVLTLGSEFNRVDFEEGVWVHRIVPHRHPLPGLAAPRIPQRIWDISASHLRELRRIAGTRAIDVVEAVSWDCESLAVLLDGEFPCVTDIVTSLSHWLDTHEQLRRDRAWMKEFGAPMLALERLVFERSTGIIGATRAILESIEGRYHVEFEESRTAYIPHGLEDGRALPALRPDAVAARRPGSGLAILFVGRLELRKGIDVLLDIAPSLLRSYRKLELWIAGDDTLATEKGATAKDRFLANPKVRDVADRTIFFGQVSEAELRWLYDACDIVVVPSRFESFGLVLVEAMMFAKPSVGCRAGGMPEVVEEGVTGLLAEPGDAGSLKAALDRLLAAPALRKTMGVAGRKRYEEKFSALAAARRRLEFLARLTDRVSSGAPREPVRAA